MPINEELQELVDNLLLDELHELRDYVNKELDRRTKEDATKSTEEKIRDKLSQLKMLYACIEWGEYGDWQSSENRAAVRQMESHDKHVAAIESFLGEMLEKELTKVNNVWKLALDFTILMDGQMEKAERAFKLVNGAYGSWCPDTAKRLCDFWEKDIFQAKIIPTNAIFVATILHRLRGMPKNSDWGRIQIPQWVEQISRAQQPNRPPPIQRSTSKKTEDNIEQQMVDLDETTTTTTSNIRSSNDSSQTDDSTFLELTTHDNSGMSRKRSKSSYQHSMTTQQPFGIPATPMMCPPVAGMITPSPPLMFPFMAPPMMMSPLPPIMWQQQHQMQHQAMMTTMMCQYQMESESSPMVYPRSPGSNVAKNTATQRKIACLEPPWMGLFDV